MNTNSKAEAVGVIMGRESTTNSISTQLDRTSASIERLVHLNEILERSLERLRGAQPTTEPCKGGVSDTAGMVQYMTYKNDTLEEQVLKAHELTARILELL